MTTRSLQALGTWRVPALAAFFLSGAAGLIAQVCWIRRAGLAFGSTVEALGAVLAVFFGGLALGAYIFGERSRHIERPLRAYALLEVALALAVVATPYGFDAAESVYGDRLPLRGRTDRRRPGGARCLGGPRAAAADAPDGWNVAAAVPATGRRPRARRPDGRLPLRNQYARRGPGGCRVRLRAAARTRHAAHVAARRGARARRRNAGRPGGLATARSRADTRERPTRRAQGARRRGCARRRTDRGAVFFCTGFAALGNEVVWTRFSPCWSAPPC